MEHNRSSNARQIAFPFSPQKQIEERLEIPVVQIHYKFDSQIDEEESESRMREIAPIVFSEVPSQYEKLK